MLDSTPIYKLIIMDFSMAGISGTQTAKKIIEKAQEANIDPPLIVCLTAYDDHKVREEALGAGMHDFYVKPIDRPTLR